MFFEELYKQNLLQHFSKTYPSVCRYSTTVRQDLQVSSSKSGIKFVMEARLKFSRRGLNCGGQPAAFDSWLSPLTRCQNQPAWAVEDTPLANHNFLMKVSKSVVFPSILHLQDWSWKHRAYHRRLTLHYIAVFSAGQLENSVF